MYNRHGMAETSEYTSWQGMKNRCFNPNYHRYSDWGGRGITVCDRWLNFENFLADMGTKPSPKHSLDRIDNNADYSPENCRWATKAEQDNNRRSNRLITIACVTLTIAQWAKKTGFNANVIHDRLKDGWSEFDAVMTPIDGKIRLIAIENETRTIAQWAKKMSISEQVINSRLKSGWSEYKAVMTPVKQRKSA